MHAPYDKRKTSYRAEPKTSVGFLMLVAAVPLVLFALILQPKASSWISQAVEAEFVSDGHGVAGTPTQVAQPDMDVPVQTVRAY